MTRYTTTYINKQMLEAGESPALCRNGKPYIGKSDTAVKKSLEQEQIWCFSTYRPRS